MATLRYFFVLNVSKMSDELGPFNPVEFGREKMGFMYEDEVHVVPHEQGVGSHEAYCSCPVKCWRRNWSNREGALFGGCAVNLQREIRRLEVLVE